MQAVMGFYQSCEPGNTARFVFGRIVKYDTSRKKLVLNISESETVDDTSLYVDVSPSDIIYYKYYSGKSLQNLRRKRICFQANVLLPV